jgi:hypothetical protein
MIKKFLVQIQAGADTRWLNDDALIADEIRFAASAVAAVNTSGAKPAVTVLVDEKLAGNDCPCARAGLKEHRIDCLFHPRFDNADAATILGARILAGHL